MPNSCDESHHGASGAAASFEAPRGRGRKGGDEDAKGAAALTPADDGGAFVLRLVGCSSVPKPRVLHQDLARRRRNLKLPGDGGPLVDAIVGPSRVAHVLMTARHDPCEEQPSVNRDARAAGDSRQPAGGGRRLTGATVVWRHVLRAEIPDRRESHAHVGKRLLDRAAVLPRALRVWAVRREVMRPAAQCSSSFF